jgi:hypothetical protein
MLLNPRVLTIDYSNKWIYVSFISFQGVHFGRERVNGGDLYSRGRNTSMFAK